MKLNDRSIFQPQYIRIRIRESEKLTDGRRDLRANIVFAALAVGESKVLAQQVWGTWVFVVGLWLEDGSLLLVATMDNPDSALSDYANRLAFSRPVAFV